MTPERFWELLDTLDGVADDETCARLHRLVMRTGEGPDFSEMVDSQVGALVVGCRWPDELAGSDAISWVAAAVVAAGRASYDAVRASGEVDPEQWSWSDAEALLVVGFEPTEEDEAAGPPTDHGEPVPPVAITMQWLSLPSPVGVRTPHENNGDTIVDLGDNPDMGRFPVHDPDWMEAQRRLAADPSFLARRRSVEHLGLWLTVRPVLPAGEPAPEPSGHWPFDRFRPVSEAVAHHVETKEGPGVVLVVPVSDFPDPGSRVDGYLAAVDRLLQAADA